MTKLCTETGGWVGPQQWMTGKFYRKETVRAGVAVVAEPSSATPAIVRTDSDRAPALPAAEDAASEGAAALDATPGGGAIVRPLVALGTFPPPTTILGASTRPYDSIEIEITLGGTHRELQFTWKLDGIVQAKSQSPSDATGQYALGATGLTVQFSTDPRHPYPTDNVFTCAGQSVS